MITDFQKIAAVAQATGKRVKLGLMETVVDYLVLEDTALIGIARAQVDFRRGHEMIVTRRGYTMWTFRKQAGVWAWDEPVTYWLDDHEPEVYVTYAREAQDYLSKRDWEEMCYRPGTHVTPLDNAARRAQDI